MTLNPPPNHTLVTTEDGTTTVYSQHFQEAAHSLHGAKAETYTRFIQGCKILQQLELLDPPTFYIFEVGFATGLGALTTFAAWPKTQKPCHFVSVELDEDLIQWTLKNAVNLYKPFFSQDILELFAQTHYDPQSQCYQGELQNFALTIFPRDVWNRSQEILARYPQTFHAIYQDAYSPKKNPALWSSAWFSFLKKISHPQVILSTYSSSQSVRFNLTQTGWNITEGPKFGPKKSSTVATLLPIKTE